jgi:hypothetical protein
VAARVVEGEWYGMSYQVANAPCTDWSAKALTSGRDARAPR